MTKPAPWRKEMNASTSFNQKCARKYGKPIETVPRRVLEKLQGHDWPGNLRELQNVLVGAVTTTSGESSQIP
ncbi:MAG: hypothetical protein ACWGQW_19390 [bacterium]